MGIPLLVLSFFSLTILYLITLFITTFRLCKLPNFSVDSKISKLFYVFLFLICLARTCFFGVASFMYADSYELKQMPSNSSLQVNHQGGSVGSMKDYFPTESEEYMGIETSPKPLVIFLISPEYLVIFAYLILFWQLLSLYFDGHANLFKSVLKGKGKYFITVIGVVLLVSQTLLIVMYLQSSLEASVFTKQLIILNFAVPIIVFMIMFGAAYKFSGSPLRAAVYSQKLKVLQIAVFVWSLARILRAIGGMYESRLFYGMILGLKDVSHNTFIVPMMLIVVFLVIEIAPFLFVLDWHFMEIFILKPFPESLTEPLYEVQNQGNLSYLSMASAFHPQSNAQAHFMGQHVSSQQDHPFFRSGMSSSQLGDHPIDFNFRSDSVRAINESFSRHSHKYERGGSMAQTGGQLEYSAFGMLAPENFILTQSDFTLYEQFSKGTKHRHSLGQLYKIKFNDEEKQGNTQLICRVIKFTRVASYVIEEIFREIYNIRMLNSKYLLPISGVCFNEKTNVMHILMPQKISLFEYIHECGEILTPSDKLMIAKNIARAMDYLHTYHKPSPAHTHLSSRNILLNPSNFQIYIADYNMKSLKKFCKLFLNYRTHNQWSAPEIWTDPAADMFEQTSVDVYSYGILLWELETGNIPFEDLDDKTMNYMMIEQKLRPMIPDGTDNNLSLLIRRCWQDTATKRPDFKKILSSLEYVKFSQ